MPNFSHLMGPTQTISRLSTTMQLVSARLSHHCPTLSALYTIYGPAKTYELVTQDLPDSPFETLFVCTAGWPAPTEEEESPQ